MSQRAETAGVGELRPVPLARSKHDAFSPQPLVDHLTTAAPDARSVVVSGAHTFPFRRGTATARLVAVR
ncbi:hypothetical protein [Lentzea cavernae]|uniref:Uncharacterized protein n=1 Tax=Lentzea cavernae TaxID=2020703 RepID=A0ABQ3MBM4_9PSEU|nr:hypothetical protein [Lentzea cavernae]GHH38543.1 hypothetical protein GCM10017774_28630 [Lentzea cavernae]